MGVLVNKLGRDLWKQRVQGIAIALIVACGVSSQVTSYCLMSTLRQAMERYYDQERFADLFAQFRAIPLSSTRELHAISGVATIQPRLTIDAPLDIRGESDQPTLAKIIAIPKEFESTLNRLVVRQGAHLSELAKNEIILSEVFAEGRSIALGDSIFATIEGKKIPLVVRGIALSPEFLFQIREGAGVPDNKRFGVIWMRYDDLATASGLVGQVNQIHFRLRDPARLSIIRQRVEQELNSLGLLSLIDRSMQDSHRYTNNAIGQLRSVAIVPPAIFMAVASFLIYLTLSRLLKTEREQIAMLRAFGYTVVEIGQHYFLYVLILVLLGSGIGIAMGVALAEQATANYQEIYRFPSLPVVVELFPVMRAVLIAACAGLAGSAVTILRAVRIPPAIGLRPEPPTSYRYREGWFAVWMDLLSPISRMVLRGLGRWPLRTALGILGIALGISVMILGGYTQDAIAYVVDYEFLRTRRYDILVQFAEKTNEGAIDEIARLPGVLSCEPFSSQRCTFAFGKQERHLTLFGLPPGHQLVQPLSRREQRVELEDRGIVISEALAASLQVKPGNKIEVEFEEGEKRKKELVAVSLIVDYAGLNAYASRTSLNRWLGTEGGVGGVWIHADSQWLDVLMDELHRRPRIVAVTIKSQALEDFRSSFAKNILLFRIFNMLFSSAIAIGSVLSIASISLVERKRDLALLRLLGYSSNETGRVLRGELLVLSIAAVPVGCVAGYAFAWIATTMLNTETQRIPTLVDPSTYVAAVCVSLVSSSLAAWIIQLRVNRLDPVSLLKSKD